MNHADHVRLLSGGALAGGVWADLGAGAGAFSLALAELLGPGGALYSVDKDRGALAELERAVRRKFPALNLHIVAADFTQPMQMPALDGIVMANSLHFHSDPEIVMKRIRTWLRPGGRLLIVEYNTDSGNPWVPYPLSFSTWQALAARLGFSETRLLATQPSRFLKEIYSAVSY